MIKSALLSVRDLQVAYPVPGPWFGAARERIVLKGVSFDCEAGQCIGIVGESGSGKSTMGRALLRLTPLKGGQIHFDGTNLATLDDDQLRPWRARLQMIFQDPLSSLNPRRTVAAIVLQPLLSYGRLAGLSKAEKRNKAAQLLELVALPASFLDRYPIQLSGGQRQRVGIARAIALEPDVIVADEVVSGLDVSTQARILTLLRELRDRLNLSLIFITHDLSVVRVLCDQVLVMEDGQIVESGSTQAIFDRPRSSVTQKLLAAIPLPEVEHDWLDQAPSFKSFPKSKEKQMKISDSVVMVTGANRGLGNQTVQALLAAGAKKVYAASRKPEALADLLTQHGDRVEAVTLDITDAAQVNAAAKQCADVSLLINNAGVNRMSGLIAAGSTDAARAELETNYLGTLAMCQAFAPVLKANGGGGIVNVLSILAKIALPAMGSLCASKAAGLRMTEGVRAELAEQGTWVAALMTGAVDTDMSAGFDGPKSAPTEVAAALLAGIEAGDEEIYFGEMTDWVNGALSQDPKALEQEFAKFLPG